MRMDRPREGDEPARSRWYGEHVTREDAIESQRHKARASRPLTQDRYARRALAPEQYRARWYERRGVPRDQTPAPFNADKARAVPDFERGGRTRGRLDVQEGPDVDLVSGNRGGEIMRRFKELHGDRLPHELGFVPFNYHHVEAQAAAYMRMNNRRTASLYVNKRPCRTEPDGCALVLPKLLPPGARLTVFGPDGYVSVYRGVQDERRG